MKIGICGGVERAAVVARHGYDYVEENLSSIVGLSEEGFAKKLAKARAAQIPIYALNCFVTSDTPVLSDTFLEKAEEYAKKALGRAAMLGAKICVIGSGKARSIPDGMDRSFAEERFVDILKIFGAEADKHGIRIVVEPLNKGETNFITTVGEAADIVRRCGAKNVGTMIDFHHFTVENETGENLPEIKDLIFHAHIARSAPDRTLPMAEDKDELERWLGLLRSIDYKGALTIEAKYGDFESEISERRQYLEGFFSF